MYNLHLNIRISITISCIYLLIEHRLKVVHIQLIATTEIKEW